MNWFGNHDLSFVSNIFLKNIKHTERVTNKKFTTQNIFTKYILLCKQLARTVEFPHSNVHPHNY